MAINYTYPVKGSPVAADEFLIIDSVDNSTKKVTASSVLSLTDAVATFTAASPLVNVGDAKDVSLTLSTVPVSKGGTGLTAIGTPHQVPTVNEAGTALEYKDTTIIETVKNDTASTIPKGTPLHATGWNESEEVAEVEPADAANVTLMPCIGLAENDIPAGQIGHSLIVGILDEIRTNNYGVDVGDVLYVSPDGGLTGTRPTGTNIIQPVAVILKSAGNGAGVLQVATVSQGATMPNVNTGEIIVGNSTNIGQSVAMTGEVSISKAGVTEVTGIDGNVSIQGYRPIVTVTSDSKTLSTTDVGKYINFQGQFGGSNSKILTLPSSAEIENYEVGTEIEVVNNSTPSAVGQPQPTLTVRVDLGSNPGTINGLSNIVLTAKYASAKLKLISSTSNQAVWHARITQ